MSSIWLQVSKWLYIIIIIIIIITIIIIIIIIIVLWEFRIDLKPLPNDFLFKRAGKAIFLIRISSNDIRCLCKKSKVDQFKSPAVFRFSPKPPLLAPPTLSAITAFCLQGEFWLVFPHELPLLTVTDNHEDSLPTQLY